ncbi:MAG: thioredoxin domain-containing protein [Gemmatimonadetes bacterium]|nr:thioredoxin domain-containing protein [Gemmatimonadota bacterium]
MTQLDFPLSRRVLATALALSAAASACSGGDDSRRAARQGPSIADSVRARRNARLALRPDTMGNRIDSLRIEGTPSASVYIVVATDFQCEECRALARDVIPVLRREYVEAGLARLAYINAPQDAHFNARFAALAALCAAGSGRFREMHDTLFATQAQWARREDPRPWFDSLAVAVGADSSEQARCTGRQMMLRLLASDIERVTAAGITSVPTILVGDTRLSGDRLTLPLIRRAVDAARR